MPIAIIAVAVIAIVLGPVLLVLLLIPATPAMAGLGACAPVPAVFAEANMQPGTVAVGRCIAEMWPEVKVIGGYRPTDAYADHPSGQALDVMMPHGGHTRSDIQLGDEIGTWLMNTAETNRVVYIIWRHRTWNYAGKGPANRDPTTPPGAWRATTDRGGWTANHMDHLHIAINGPAPLGGQPASPADDWRLRGFDGPPPTPATLDGGGAGWVYPLKGGLIGSEAGWRYHPILRYTKCHEGADMSAPTGTPIRAAAAGTVTSAGPTGGYGNYTIIDHGNQITTGYGHQSRIQVRRGQTVNKGQVIGYVGSTGLSTGPHLHFNLFVNKTPHNPRGWLDNNPALQRAVCV
jgi:murein DD-endopeptidase MepM/ murein hydrolase activator NlpD